MSTQRPKTQVQLTPFQAENVSTNQQKIALPYLGGERVVAVRWMTSLSDKREKNADSHSKKG